jgi:hypothetical protein
MVESNCHYQTKKESEGQKGKSQEDIMVIILKKTVPPKKHTNFRSENTLAGMSGCFA